KRNKILDFSSDEKDFFDEDDSDPIILVGSGDKVPYYTSDPKTDDAEDNSPDDPENYTYLVCITTGRGWGPGKVGYGDEFQLKVVSLTFGGVSDQDEYSSGMNSVKTVFADSEIIGGTTAPDPANREDVTQMIYEIIGPVIGVNKYDADTVTRLNAFFGYPLGSPEVGRQDQKFLDFWPHSVIGIDACGGTDPDYNSTDFTKNNVNSNQQLRRIDLEFKGQNFTPSDLRPITSDKNSGIAIYANNPNHTALEQRQTVNIADPPSSTNTLADYLLPLSVDRTQWTKIDNGHYRVSLYLADGAVLPIDNNSDNTRGWDYLVAILLDKEADYSDSFEIIIPQQSIFFTNGAVNATYKIFT
ncbi:MAG TPA: hypothetical protein PLJ38_12340, partial [bacterium]|nr:hypothetical protein [bacterium]